MGHVHQSLELLSHFTVQYLIVALAGLLVLIILHAWWSALVACATCVLNLVMVVPWYVSPATVPAAADANPRHTPVRFLSANVESTNDNFSEFISLVFEENPDVVIIQEATEAWIERLSVLQQQFPYSKTLPRPRSVGIALYSQIPVERFEVIFLGSERLPALLARLSRGSRVLSVVAVHPRPPHRRMDFRHRNEQLRDAASVAQALAAPKILMGDLNTSLWSPYYGQLIRRTGLTNARKGFGVVPTWPAFLPWSFLRIPIDHCLVSPDIGSDHLPIVVDLVIPG